MNLVEIYRNLQQQKIRNRNIRIPLNGIILEVGSGGSPHPGANILLDKYISDGFERGGQKVNIDERFFIQADATKLPFKDKSIDFLICSHLLEHLDAPDLLINEMERVAVAGYIEVPSATFEKLHSFPFHKWMINYDKRENVLLFTRKNGAIFDHDITQMMSFSTNAKIFQKLYQNGYQNDLIIQFPWQGKINFQIIADHHTNVATDEIASATLNFHQDYEILNNKIIQKESFPKKLRRCWQVYQRRKNLITKEQLLGILSCPKCKGNLVENLPQDLLTCNHCHLIIHFSKNIIYFDNNESLAQERQQ